MNALDGLKNKMATNGYMTNIEMAIYNTTEKFPITALHAAEELAEKDAALDAAREFMLQVVPPVKNDDLLQKYIKVQAALKGAK